MAPMRTINEAIENAIGVIESFLEGHRVVLRDEDQLVQIDSVIIGRAARALDELRNLQIMALNDYIESGSDSLMNLGDDVSEEEDEEAISPS